MGANPNQTSSDGNTALHYIFSIFERDPTEAEKIANLLLENGADPNIQNHDRWSPLHIATNKGNFNAVKFAIDYNRMCYF